MSDSNANIHLIGDEESDSEKESNHKTPIFLKIVYKGDPREQTFLSYLKEVICPFFRFKSFSFIILIINLIVFIFSSTHNKVIWLDISMYEFPTMNIFYSIYHLYS